MFEHLVAAFKQHFKPKSLVIAERFPFHRRTQVEAESINEYIAELRRLTTHCKFGAFLDEALRDRLVCGLRNEGIQKSLLTEADLTLARANDLAVGMEAAEKNAKSLKGMESVIKSIYPYQGMSHKEGSSVHCCSLCTSMFSQAMFSSHEHFSLQMTPSV